MSTFFGLKEKPYPLDSAALGSTPWTNLASAPLPRYPANDELFSKLFRHLYNASLSTFVPLCFSLPTTSSLTPPTESSRRMATRTSQKVQVPFRCCYDSHLGSQCRPCYLQRMDLCLMAPYVVDFFVQGWSAAGYQGVKLALCSMPTPPRILESTLTSFTSASTTRSLTR